MVDYQRLLETEGAGEGGAGIPYLSRVAQKAIACVTYVCGRPEVPTEIYYL